jgi:hypothetical protein
MRDDLHKTVPLSRPWSRVLRRLAKERLSAAELAPLIVGTVQQDAALGTDAGELALASAIQGGCADLFDSGDERMRMTLLQIQDGQISATARATCEMALVVLATNGMTARFREQVLQAAGVEYARAQIEHIAARVAAVYGFGEASQVRHVLSDALKLCDFTRPVSLSVSRKQKSVGEMLSTELLLQA